MKTISRRRLLQAAGLAGMTAVIDYASSRTVSGESGKLAAPVNYAAHWEPRKLATPMMQDPVWVYDN